LYRRCTLPLLFVLIVIVPLADASPPDPLWLAGIYDGADSDEAVVAVVSASGVVRDVPTVLVKPTDVPTGAVRPHVTVLGAAVPSSTFSIRAPPSATVIITTI